jgi:hypothetical protein
MNKIRIVFGNLFADYVVGIRIGSGAFDLNQSAPLNLYIQATGIRAVQWANTGEDL